MAMTYNEVPEKSDLSCEGCCFSKEIMKPVTRKGAIAKKVGSGQWGCFAPLKEPFMSCKKNHTIFKEEK